MTTDIAPGSVTEALRRLDQAPPGPRSLYYRWESEQWEAGALGLTTDRSSWATLAEDAQGSILAALGCFLVPDGRVGELLVPFVDAVPSEEEQVFLTSQLVDEARAVVFCDRLRSEVVEEAAGARVRWRPNDRLGRLLDLVEPRAADVRVSRESGPVLHEGLLLLGVILSGVLAPAFQRRLGTWVEENGGFPGVAAGLRSLALDTTRHTHFAVRLLQEAIADDARDEKASAPALEACIEEALPLIRGIVSEGARASNDFSGLPFGEEDLGPETMDCLALRMQDIGLDLPI